MNQSSPYKLLTILTIINFLNYFDRQIIFPLFSQIKAEFKVSDFQLGLLGTGFLIIYGIGAIPFGYLADHWSKKKIIGLGFFFWSLMTALGGLAKNFWQLLTVRSLVGVGESAYTPASTALITENFPAEKRAIAQSWFNLGMFLGGVSGLMAGGILGSLYGWRSAFFIVGLPGLILATLSFALKENQSACNNQSQISWRDLLRIPAFLFVILSGVFVTFAAGAFISWGTEFVIRYHNFSIHRASISLGILILIAGFFGVLTGGYLADKIHKKFVYGRSLVIALAFLISSPIIFWSIYTSSSLHFFIAFFLASFFLSWYHGPTTAVIHDLVPPSAYGLSFAIYSFAIRIFGETPAPSLVGKISDLADLRTGLLFAAISNLIGAILFLLVIYFIKKAEVKPSLIKR